MIDVDKEAWSQLIDEQSSADLTIIKDMIVTALALRRSSNHVEFIFEQLRQSFCAGTSPRFSSVQVSFFPPWEARSEKQKKEFRKAWGGAVNFFTEQGFNDNKALHKFITMLVANSALFDDKLEWSTTIASLTKVEHLLADQWPYSKSAQGLDFIKEVINGNNIRSSAATTGISTTRCAETQRSEPVTV